MMMPPSARLGPVAKGAVMSDGAVGEFAAELRAQIADARAEFEQAREAEDLERVQSIWPRLRYLLEVAADNGIDVDGAPSIAPIERAAWDAEG